MLEEVPHVAIRSPAAASPGSASRARFVRETASGCLSFYDESGALLLREAPAARHLQSATTGGEARLAAAQGFVSPPERLYGTGCFQDGHLNLHGLPRQLTQVNTQISQPFLLSSKGYGLLWHNPGGAELNRPDNPIALTRAEASGPSQVGC